MAHVVQIGFFSDPERRSPERLLEDWPTLVDVADAASRTGTRVTVVQASARSEQLKRDGVNYHFLPFAGAKHWDLLGSLAPDLYHVHGLHFPQQVFSLAERSLGAPIILQDHASRPPRIWLRNSMRRGMSVAAGVAFCSLEQARPFARAGLIGASTHVYEIPESTSRFAPGNRDVARRATGLEGNPAVLWVGHLNANKDPLTVLRGISAALGELPQLRLYCCYGNAPLLRLVEKQIASDTRLRDRVHLLGRMPHERIELLMRAADVFVLGSHSEGSGYSLIEALACGLPPVVTDIPSFRSLTRVACGAVGELWPCEDWRALSRALISAASHTGPAQRDAVRAHFERHLSSNALGVKLTAMYEDVLARKRRAAGAHPAAVRAVS